MGGGGERGVALSKLTTRQLINYQTTTCSVLPQSQEPLSKALSCSSSEIPGRESRQTQPRSQGSLLPRSVGRVGENPGNEVETDNIYS